MDEERRDIPAEILRIDFLRREHNKEKYCRCDTLQFDVDTTNREVSCRSCGAIVDPFDVLVQFSRRWDRINDDILRAREQARELYQYQPHLRALKELEGLQRRKMMPHCPHCKLPVDLVELSKSGAAGREYGEMQIEQAKEKKAMAKSKCDACDEPTKRPFGFWDGYDADGNHIGGLEYTCESEGCEVAVLRRMKAHEEADRRAQAQAQNAANGIDVQKLRKARQNARCTLGEAATRLGFSAAQYSAYETERLPMPMIVYNTLCEYLEGKRQ